MLAHLNFTLPKGWCRQYQQDPTRSFSPVVSFNPQEALDCLIHASTKPEKCDMLLKKNLANGTALSNFPSTVPLNQPLPRRSQKMTCSSISSLGWEELVPLEMLDAPWNPTKKSKMVILVESIS